MTTARTASISDGNSKSGCLRGMPNASRHTSALVTASPPASAPSAMPPMPRSAASRRSSVTPPRVVSHTCVPPYGEISSHPLSPRTTSTRSPRSANTCAITGSMRTSEQPMSPAAGRAGFVSGPRMLKIVGTPSSRRTGAACFIAGCKTCAKAKAIPSSRAHDAIPCGSRSMATPSSSSTSAVPHFDDAARLPCLTIVAPHAAATMAAIVEKLTEPDESPPVPTTSSRTPGTSTGSAAARMASAAAATSSGVGPLACRPSRSAPIWAGVASPAITSARAQRAESASRSSPAARRPRTEGHEGAAGIIGTP